MGLCLWFCEFTCGLGLECKCNIVRFQIHGGYLYQKKKSIIIYQYALFYVNLKHISRKSSLSILMWKIRLSFGLIKIMYNRWSFFLLWAIYWFSGFRPRRLSSLQTYFMSSIAPYLHYWILKISRLLLKLFSNNTLSQQFAEHSPNILHCLF